MKKTTIFAGALILIVIEICIIVGGMSKDKKKPEITINPSQISYKVGCSDSEILKGVTAKDDKDGDVTSSLIISKRVELSVGHMELITLVACDKAGNVTKSDVLFIEKEDGTFRVVSYEDYYVDVDKMLVSVKGEDTTVRLDEIYTSKRDDETTGEVSGEDATTAPNVDNQDKPTQPSTQPPTQPTTADLTSGKPVIILKNKEITVKKGDRLNSWVTYIKDIIDDNDVRDTLFTRVSLTDFNMPRTMDKVGDFVQGFYCVDSDGNISDKVYMTIHVVENNKPTNPTTQPTTKPVEETTTKPVDESTTKPVEETTTEPVEETTTEPVEETTTKPVEETTTEEVEDTTTKPVEETTTETVVEPTTEELTTEPVTEATEDSTTEPLE